MIQRKDDAPHYARTDPNDDVVHRVGKVMEEAGWSIFISTLTTVFAFMLGVFANFSSIPTMIT